MRALLLVLLAAAGVSAHIVPVPPSTCAFDPVTIEMPVAGTAAPAASADTFRILYDPQSSTAQFDLSGVPPRSFTAAGTDGTLALPSLFVATLRNDGDLTAMPSLTVTTGSGSGTVAVPLTTGLAVARDTVLEGVPLAADGSFTLIGVVDPSPLPAPLGGGPLAVRLRCVAVPRPDTDQFRLATRTTPVSASLTAKLLKGRVIFGPGTNDTADFPGRPALMRVSSGDATIATVDLADGLAARGRKLFVGRSADGQTAIGVRALRRSGAVAYLLALKVKNPTMPAVAGASVSVGITYDVGGLLSHASLPMRAKRGGALLRYP
jgi:hypothetical protein